MPPISFKPPITLEAWEAILSLLAFLPLEAPVARGTLHTPRSRIPPRACGPCWALGPFLSCGPLVAWVTRRAIRSREAWNSWVSGWTLLPRSANGSLGARESLGPGISLLS